MKKISLFLFVALLFSGCTATQKDIPMGDPPVNETSIHQPQTSGDDKAYMVNMLKPYEDVRGKMFAESMGVYVETRVLAPNEYNVEDMYTYQFNEYTVFSGNEELQQEIMERGKNPGLGIRALHERGITGQGITVAIIDQELSLEPPEFSDKIVEYYEVESEIELLPSSMHGAAVASILVGETTGVAPGTNVYYVAVPTRIEDASYFADGLDWIVNKNETLPEDDKIRLVSVQGNPSGIESKFSNQELWEEAVARAQAAGILVMDTRAGEDTNFVEHGHYDFNEPDNIEKARNGSLSYGVTWPTIEGYVSVPCDYRTTIEQYDEGDFYFRYAGAGGLSWGIPYAAGVLALGWQVNPHLTAKEIKQLLIESAYENEYGERIIYPAAFIGKVKATL